MDRKKIIWPVLMAGTAAMNHAEALTPAAAKPIGTPEIQTEENAPQDRPNILWLTFEDTSFYEFGCYGNRDVHTPNTDSLAAHGVLFTNAWSNAPQSSPARSSLITGCYATTYGMDIHPVSTDTPENILFPQLLRDAGYYCTNNRKTHYNTTLDNKSCWDECDKTASYNSPQRKEGQPFFAVFNTATSHMGRVRTFHTDGRRDYTLEGIYPQLLDLPPHVPDLAEVRSDYAGHLEAVQDVDKWVGFFLEDLKKQGLDDDTIIFIFSDHGGCLPRGKGYLYETGLHVPLIVYFPEKWRHLAPGSPSGQNRPSDKDTTPGLEYTSPAGFVDLAPSVLSLAGIKPPAHMQGKALMGQYASGAHRYHYAFATNHLHHFTPVRAVSDGQYKYIRSYMPYRQFALRNYYQWGMPSNKAWDRLVLGGHNTNPDWDQPFGTHPAEMLFDLEADPFELHDLSADPEYQEVLGHVPELPFSNTWVAQQLSGMLPDGCVFHLAGSNTAREWNFFPIPKSVICHSNDGTMGIDGQVSAMVGESLASPEKIHMGAVGDLTFFYDMNSIGNRHITSNFRLMIVNNGKGAEFKLYSHPAYQFGEAGDAYMAAAGHFGDKSGNLIRHYAEDLGFEYLCASDKDSFMEAARRFTTVEMTERPMIFEVFTDSKADSDGLYAMNHLIHNAAGSTKSFMRGMIKAVAGEKGVEAVKGLLRK